MNRIHDNTNRPPDDDEALELLVDGELDEARRRELLLQLERQPDGWRRCALAFLEAQAIGQDMKALVRGQAAWLRTSGAAATAPAAASPGAGPAARRRWLDGRGGTVLAMAASFLIALGLGTLLRDLATRNGPTSPDPNNLVSGNNPDSRGAPVDPGVVPSPRPEASGPWQLVNLGVHDGPDGTGRSIQLPARQRDSLDEAWLSRLPGAMPDDVRQALQRTGHEVRQSRQYLPLRLKDGRQLIVPVDQIDVHSVGNQPYQ